MVILSLTFILFLHLGVRIVVALGNLVQGRRGTESVGSRVGAGSLLPCARTAGLTSSPF